LFCGWLTNYTLSNRENIFLYAYFSSNQRLLAQPQGHFFIFKPSFHHPPYIGKQLSLTTGFTLSNQTFIQW
jgi:hypothetical protein